MADPKTIIDYATNRSAGAEQALTAAQQRLVAAQSDLALINTEASSASGALADLERQAAGIRRQLSGIVTPADGTALITELEELIVRMRAQQAAIVKIQERVSVARANSTEAQTELSAVAAEKALAAVALEKATKSNTDRAAWSDALNTPPLATIHTQASNALDAANPTEGLPFKEATNRLKLDIPVKLFERAQSRRAETAKLIAKANKITTDAENAILKERGDHGGLAGVAAKLLVLFQRAEAAARDFVNTAESSFDQANSMLVEVGDGDRSPLTVEQKERINDAALTADREVGAAAEASFDSTLRQAVANKQDALDAATLQAKVDPSDANKNAVNVARGELATALSNFAVGHKTWEEKGASLSAATDAVNQKQAALDAAIQQAIADGNDPETDPAVDQAKDDLATAEGNLASVRNAYALDFWEAAVPDTTWHLFEKYEDAIEILTTLKNTNPATLRSDLKSTEENYVAAQLAADKSTDVLLQLANEYVQRVARQEGVKAVVDARLFSALRGDE